MKFVEKFILVPAEEWKIKQNHSVEKKDVSTMTEESEMGNKSIPKRSIGTMTESALLNEHVPIIAVLPPGIPKYSKKKRKLERNPVETVSKVFKWKEL